MSVNPYFEGAGQKEGLEIWRIEKLKVVRQDESTFGTFHTGDSYIVLSTTKKDDASSQFEWTIHFWLGKTTTQDEAGTAALKSIELDDLLGGAPELVRETQDHESRGFLNYFPKGIKYVEGGVETVFEKAQSVELRKRLFQIKGKKNTIIVEVKLHAESLNKGDTFVLDDGKKIYVWKGQDSGSAEWIKGAALAKMIRDDERGGKAQINYIDEGKDNSKLFFEALGSQVEIAKAQNDDSDTKRVNLYRMVFNPGEMELDILTSRPLKKEDLKSEACYLLDYDSRHLCLWLGGKCTVEEKKMTRVFAEKYMSQKAFPTWTTVKHVVEGHETLMFTQYFDSWPDTTTTVAVGMTRMRLAGDSEDMAGVAGADVASEMLRHRKRKTEILPDDATGNLKIWRTENNDLIPQSKDDFGIFYTGDSYVMLYEGSSSSQQNQLFIIYFWQGAKSSVHEKSAAALQANGMDRLMGGVATQIRVVQGKEPEHLLRALGGKMIILLGGINNKEPDSDIRMFQVKGDNLVTRAAQVQPRTAALNSNDVFIVDCTGVVTLWYGKGSSDEERSVAKKVLKDICPKTAEIFPSQTADVLQLHEGKESDEFWACLGGKEEYATGKQLEGDESNSPVRLFQLSNSTGWLVADEVFDFTQEDLEEKDVMILDAIDEVYIWLGKGANNVERKESMDIAMEYLKQSGRSPDDTVISVVKQGLENPAFTGQFLAWDWDKWADGACP